MKNFLKRHFTMKNIIIFVIVILLFWIILRPSLGRVYCHSVNREKSIIVLEKRRDLAKKEYNWDEYKHLDNVLDVGLVPEDILTKTYNSCINSLGIRK